MRAGRLPGEIRPHPGYRTAATEQARDQFVDYAQHLGRSRIALVLGTKFDYALAKYPESAMAGCLLIGDIPTEMHNTLGRYMVQIDPHMPDEQMVKEIRWWMEHDDEAQALAAASQRLALSEFTMERYAEQFVRRAREFLDQARQHQRQVRAICRPGRLRWTLQTWLGEPVHVPTDHTPGTRSVLMSDACMTDTMPDSVAPRSASQTVAQSRGHWHAEHDVELGSR
jgi:hypothetical protein